MKRKLSKIWKIRKESDRYRLMKYGYDLLGVIGFFVLVGEEPGEPSMEILALRAVIGMLLVWISFIGNRYYRHMERDAIREQRAEARRAMKSAS